MKKLFLLLAVAALPFMFVSCDSDDDTLGGLVDNLTGTVKFTMGSESYSYTGAVAKSASGKLCITTGDAQGAVALTIAGKSAGTYSLGIGPLGSDVISNATTILNFVGNGADYSALTNTFVFYPYSGEKYVIIGGTCTITESGTQVKGTFSGVAVSWSQLSKMDLEAIKTLIGASNNKVSGSFIAYSL